MSTAQNPPSSYAPPPPEPKNGFGITALVLAIIGLVFGLIPIVGGFIALILGVLAILFGLLGLGRVRRRRATNKKMAIIATILGLAAAALGIYSIVILFQATGKLVNDLNQTSGQLNSYNACIQQAPTPADAAKCKLPRSGG